ncbi:MAG: hypothetical protein Q7S77_01000 [Candidatus Staskawiczbacteria bacterium]|nr:hypothetical protein [Candidatus Staskawiczbacteria bacterium]
MIFKNQEKGVSLIITFFILTIILAVVLSVSILLYGEVKIVRNIGNSVIAFYAADSGVEKILYYDRKQIPEGGARGLCNINNVCPDCTPGPGGDCVESKCYNWLATGTGSGCDLLTCGITGSCEISFESFFDGKSYEVKASIIPGSDTNIDIKGDYQSISRKIQLKIASSPCVSANGNCWYKGEVGQSCDIVCDNNNKMTVPGSRCVQPDTDCTVINSFFTCSSYDDPYVIPYYWSGACGCGGGIDNVDGPDSDGGWCSFSDPDITRICVCQ